jgi:hypothetical protein
VPDNEDGGLYPDLQPETPWYMVDGPWRSLDPKVRSAPTGEQSAAPEPSYAPTEDPVPPGWVLTQARGGIAARLVPIHEAKRLAKRAERVRRNRRFARDARPQ